MKLTRKGRIWWKREYGVQEEGGVIEVYMPYSMALNEMYDRFVFLEKLVGILCLVRTSRSLIEKNTSSWLRNNILK